MKNNDGSNGLRARGSLSVPNAYEKLDQREIHYTSKLDVYNWLDDVNLPLTKSTFNIIEVRFKNSRKEFFKKPDEMHVDIGDMVAVEANSGHDIGIVSLTGDLVKIQMRKNGIKEDSPEIKQVYRRARDTDIEKWKNAIDLEKDTMLKARQIVKRLDINMKVTDVEYQGDGTKAIFYYTAEGRVDFRQLIKDLASEFAIRIEMKQIGARQESARIGGIGPCGRELCCATWLHNFRSVSTSVAREQQLSLNPQKLIGQCGKLKCCLNFEFDVYVDALKKFPANNISLETKQGKLVHHKTDIFKEILWMSYENEENNSVLIQLSLETVNKILEMNRNGEIPESVEEFNDHTDDSDNAEDTTQTFSNVVGQDDVHRFDKQTGKDKKKKNKPGKGKNKEINKKQSENSGQQKKQRPGKGKDKQ